MQNQTKNIIKPKILIAPLDWGLGHTTRCIPIIRHLTELGCEVFVACNKNNQLVLQTEFPQLQYLFLKGYNIKYARKNSLTAALLFQLPKIYNTIRYEKDWLRRAVQHFSFDAVISDNRFGFFHKKIFSVYITHQLSIRTGLGKRIDRWLQKWHYHFINKYNEVWVPDFEGEKNFAGSLSHPIKLPVVNVKYLGGLSRFDKKASDVKQYDALIILSGPEPQRTIFENILLQQTNNTALKVALVRGLPTNDILPAASTHITVFNHLPAIQLNTLIEQSNIIISRSGYTTVMDLVRLQKKAILVPTPGQPEQEYLAQYLYKQKIFYSVEQENFNVQQSIKAALQFENNFLLNDLDFEKYKTVLLEFVQNLKKLKMN